MKKLITLIGAVAMAFGLCTAKADSVKIVDLTNTFEDGLGEPGMPDVIPGEFTWNYDSEKTEYDLVWFSAATEADEITATVKAYGDDEALTGAGNSYLEIETGNNPLFRTAAAVETDEQTSAKIAQPVDIAQGVVFDQLVKFSAYESEAEVPTNDGTMKIGIWLKQTEEDDDTHATDGLYVSTAMLNESYDPILTNVLAVLPANVAVTGGWNRLTITAVKAIDWGTGGFVPGFVIAIDGNEISYTGDQLFAAEVNDATRFAAPLITAKKLFPGRVAYNDGGDTLVGIGMMGSGAVDKISIAKKEFQVTAAEAVSPATATIVCNPETQVSGEDVVITATAKQGFSYAGVTLSDDWERAKEGDAITKTVTIEGDDIVINDVPSAVSVGPALPWSGAGTQASPYIVANAAGLTAMANSEYASYLGCHFQLSADITLSEAFNIGTTFTGVFDGQGHTITFTAAKVTDDSDDCYAFFTKLGDGAVVKNAIFNGTVEASAKLLAVVAAQTTGTVTFQGVTAQGTVTCGYNAAGLVANLQGSVSFTSCTNEADVTSTAYMTGNKNAKAGGFVCYAGANDTSMTFIDCVNAGGITASGSMSLAGGFIGMIDKTGCTASFNGCVNEGTITTIGSEQSSSNKSAAGFIGDAKQNNATPILSFTNCANVGPIVGENAESITGNTFVIASLFNGAPNTTTPLTLAGTIVVRKDIPSTDQAIAGLTYGLVDDDIATITDTLEAGNTYAVLASGAAPVIELANEGDTITFIETVAISDDSGVTVGEGLALDENDLVEGQITYTAIEQAPTTFTVTVPKMANAEVSVTTNGEAVVGVEDVYTVEAGATVVVTYTATEGNIFADGSTSASKEYANVAENVNVSLDDFPAAPALAVAQVGNTKYETLAEAVVVDGDVTLLANVTLTETLTIAKAKALNLAGKTITFGDGLKNGIVTTDAAQNLVISNGNFAVAGTRPAGGFAFQLYRVNATIKDVTMDVEGFEYGLEAETMLEPMADNWNDPTYTITCENVKVQGNGSLFHFENVNATLDENCSATLKGTSFGGAHAAAIYSSCGAKVTVNGGTYTAPNALQTGNLGGDITVKGGTFNGNIKSFMYENDKRYDGNKATIAIAGGTFTGDFTYATDQAGECTKDCLTWNITGGTFSVDPTTYLNEGYKAVKNQGEKDTWTVSAKAQYDVTVECAEGATVNGVTAGKVYEGTNINFTVTVTDETKVIDAVKNGDTTLTDVGGTYTIADVQANVAIKVTLKTKEYDITFTDAGAWTNVVKTNHGEMPAAPEAPAATGMSFKKWNPEVVAAVAPATYTAVYTGNVYAITYTYTDGTDPVTVTANTNPESFTYGVGVDSFDAAGLTYDTTKYENPVFSQSSIGTDVAAAQTITVTFTKKATDPIPVPADDTKVAETLAAAGITAAEVTTVADVQALNAILEANKITDAKTGLTDGQKAHMNDTFLMSQESGITPNHIYENGAQIKIDKIEATETSGKWAFEVTIADGTTPVAAAEIAAAALAGSAKKATTLGTWAAIDAADIENATKPGTAGKVTFTVNYGNGQQGFLKIDVSKVAK